MDSLAAPVSHVAVALLVAAAIAAVAHRRHLLDPGGSVAATLLGPALVATGGWWLGALLVAFFTSSALLPGTGNAAPRRNWHQVIANGGPALLFAGAHRLTGFDPSLAGAAATIAATTADTWATEIGRAWGGAPWSIGTRRRVPPGTSGAVSIAGTIATVAGGIAIGLTAWLLRSLAPGDPPPTFALAIIIAGTGALGGGIDTVLGATVQARYTCVVCGYPAESGRPHQPGHPMRHAAGLPGFTNSVVNLAAALAAGVVAMAAAAIAG